MSRLPVKPPEWIDAAPTVVDESVIIAASCAEVWSHIADHASWPTWFDALDNVVPHAVSDRVGGGRSVTTGKLTLVEEFTAWDEVEHFAFAVVDTKIPLLGALAESVRLESVGDGCRVTYRQGVEGRRGFDWLVGRLWARGPGRQLPKALANLKQRAESSAA